VKVLVLRAEPSGSRTRHALELLGHEAVAAPLFQIVAVAGKKLPPPQLHRTYEIVIAASANAFAMLAPESRAALHGLPAMVVGTRSAEMAEGLGLRLACPPYRTAQALAAALDENTPPGPILYLAGQDRGPEIEAVLRRTGCDFNVAEVYAAKAVRALPESATAALQSGEIGAVLHYSTRSAKVYIELAKSAGLLIEALAPEQLCLSAGVARPLEEAGAKCLRIARLPDECELLSLLPSRAVGEAGSS
jgi:uroporphyrinogen-III synthase